ncbi:DUF4386 domain-containing protein [Agromyces sp. ISL-38]|uniref:DUF4386 domain-containing protein n=1 Tax=Agromyces sp. ISL-38 TaxID=2819107 RepID=UPI001BECD551|nr:DUF4386 domain-containing protein [Agromyces sp. ISL-38]MBT2498766.1 DUF4386 domain-containing protein [Agromyces sp. ISL-38]MBT2516546.1 DUF4386 domain-containing protein [Streptomyces sp. ISL-90]
MSMEERTNPGNGMWFAAAGALTAMAVLAFPSIGTIDGMLTAAATGSETAAGGGIGEAIRASGGAFGAAVLTLMGIVVLDVIVAWGLWGVFRPMQPAAAALAAALRITYSAVFAAAIGLLIDAQRLATGVGAAETLPEDVRDGLALQRLAEFDGIWSGALIIFGAHLAVVGWLLLRRGGAFAGVVGALVAIAAAGYVFDGALPIIVPASEGGIAQFTFVGEVLLIAWLITGGVRSFRRARRARRLEATAPTGPADAAARVSA